MWSEKTCHIGRRVEFHEQLESTNSWTAACCSHPDSAGMVVIANHQVAGRGQYGRVWQSRPGSSLLMSVVLHPPPELRRPVILTAFAAVAVAEAIRELTGVQARLKWPNDLLVRGKKVCGILIETGAATVVGIGLNLSQTAEEFEQAGLTEATSLSLVSAETSDIPNTARVVIRWLDDEYGRLLAGEQVAVEADWKWRLGLLGRPVELELLDGSIVTGRLREIGFDGLEVDLGRQSIRVIPPELVRQLRACT